MCSADQECKITVFVSNDGCLNFFKENNEVLVPGFGCEGHVVVDIPRSHFKVVRVTFGFIQRQEEKTKNKF